MSANAERKSESPVVTAAGLVARYGDRTILNGVDVAIQPGEIHVILGGSGCGKSTLLKHLFGSLTPAGGECTLLGVDLVSADEPARQRVLSQVGVLFQGGALLNGLTVLENVSLPVEERSDLPAELVSELARLKLAAVGLEPHRHLYPPALSGGMKKRAALARAIATDPRVLFCDEPGAGLDPISMAALDELLLQLRDASGMAMVVVTHELPSIRRIADRVTMLDAGEVIAQGTMAEVEASKHPMVAQFFGRSDDGGDQAPTLWHALSQRSRGER